MHFIIGGGAADQFGYAQIFESYALTLIPEIIENFIPFYSYVKALFSDSMDLLESFSSNLYYVEYLYTNETFALYNLSQQFDFDTNIQDMSEGQKKKVLIAKSISEQANIYIWDEPLNYIDILTREQIEDAILNYNPTIIFVEHDEKFIEKVATKIINLVK